jgi:hypothetical protein
MRDYTIEEPEDDAYMFTAYNEPEYKIARAFFDMLKAKGFGVEVRDYQNKLEGSKDYNPHSPQFHLLDSHGKTFIEFDFLGGKFHRISGTDSTGWHGDEVDLRKY